MRLEAEVKRWGNSYAVRLTKGDLERLRLREGQKVTFIVEPAASVDLAGLPTFRSGMGLRDARRGRAQERRGWEP